MPIDEKYRKGIVDLFINNEQNKYLLLQLSKSVTKNICNIDDEQKALDYIFTYVSDIHTLLNKRLIKREMLFKYLHCKLPTSSTDFSKSDLICKVIEYWQSLEVKQTIQQVNKVEQEYPIHLLARKFAEWFFEKYNGSKLELTDFWNDARIRQMIVANDGENQYNCVGVEKVLATLMNSKLRFGFYFNPNLSHGGTQGRMDPHGLVLVLSCGTLHTQENCVGVFECIFGLLRDPFTENNWKVKTVQCMLKSEIAPRLPCLHESDSFIEALMLPSPIEELD